MRKKIIILGLVLLAAVVLSACSGQAQANTWPGLSANEDQAYLSHINLVYGINLKDGSQAWEFSDRDDGKALFYAMPVMTPDGLVVVGSAAGKYKLYGIDPKDTYVEKEKTHPTVKWTFTGAASPWSAAPLVVDNLLFAPNSDGNLYVLDLNDGQTQKQPVAAIELGGQLWAQPVSDGERIFVSSIDHTVSAVDIKTLKVLWQENIEASVPGSPAIGADGMLYVGSLASVLEQFDPAGGDHKSVMDAKNWIWSSPTASGDSLYFGDIDGNFYSYNTAEGSLNWSNQPGGSITASAFARDDRVVVATETGYIYVIGADGKILWSKMIPNASGKGNAKIYTTPVVINDLYLAAPMDASFYLVAFDGDGRQVWTFTPAK